MNQNPIGKSEIPMGLGMALAKNLDALNRFSSLSKESQQKIIEHTHSIRSKQEMAEFVTQIAEGSYF